MCFPSPGLGLFVQNKDRRKGEGFPRQVGRRPTPGTAGGGRGGGPRQVLKNENELKSGSVIPLSLTSCWDWLLSEHHRIPVASQQET